MRPSAVPGARPSTGILSRIYLTTIDSCRTQSFSYSGVLAMQYLSAEELALGSTWQRAGPCQVWRRASAVHWKHVNARSDIMESTSIALQHRPNRERYSMAYWQQRKMPQRELREWSDALYKHRPDDKQSTGGIGSGRSTISLSVLPR